MLLLDQVGDPHLDQGNGRCHRCHRDRQEEQGGDDDSYPGMSLPHPAEDEWKGLENQSGTGAWFDSGGEHGRDDGETCKDSEQKVRNCSSGTGNDEILILADVG